jgi:hypothetical protein
MFTVIDGEIEITFRGATSVARAGESINIPANAPHAFTNASERPARLLCMCRPAGQEKFFMAIGAPVPTPTARPPKLDDAAQAAFLAKRRPLRLKPDRTARPSGDARNPAASRRMSTGLGCPTGDAATVYGVWAGPQN